MTALIDAAHQAAPDTLFTPSRVGRTYTFEPETGGEIKFSAADRQAAQEYAAEAFAGLPGLLFGPDDVRPADEWATPDEEAREFASWCALHPQEA